MKDSSHLDNAISKEETSRDQFLSPECPLLGGCTVHNFNVPCRVNDSKKTLLMHAEDGAKMLQGYETITQNMNELKISHK